MKSIYVKREEPPGKKASASASVGPNRVIARVRKGFKNQKTGEVTWGDEREMSMRPSSKEEFFSDGVLKNKTTKIEPKYVLKNKTTKIEPKYVLKNKLTKLK